MQEHWEKIYSTKAVNQVSWFRPHLETSLRWIERAAAGARHSSVVDVGGGASTLVDDLLELGYSNVTVVDISQAALDVARQRLGARAASANWLRGDVTSPLLPANSIDIWHDRAVFHFLTRHEDRAAYIREVTAAVRPGGHVIVSTFGPDGPTKCSGLDVVRYGAEELHHCFGDPFQLVDSLAELHDTPFGTQQQFTSCYCVVQRPAR